MASDEIIEGEVVQPDAQEPENAVQVHQDAPVVIYNPLDAEPVAFRNQLQNRQENYDALAMHLRTHLVEGKDFGRIHLGKRDHKKDYMRCEKPYACTPEAAPAHWTDYQLLAPGADKVLGFLGLAVNYPDLQDYKRAVLKGYRLEEVISDCQIIGHNGQVIAVGAGACERGEVQGSLNNCIKRAHKRARVDAVLRLPVVSALFEKDFLAELARNASNATTVNDRQRQVKKQYNTGARLEFCPITRHHKGKPWREIPTDTLEWIMQHVNDKPDVTRAAEEELAKRADRSAPGSGSTHTPPRPDSTDPYDEYLGGQSHD